MSKKEKSPAFQLYINQFYSGISDMGAEEVGAYILLLCYQWDKGSVPDDMERIKKIAKTKKSAVVETVLQKFVKNENGLLINERLEKERDKQTANSMKRSAAGLLGNTKRWQNDSKTIAKLSQSDDFAIAENRLSISNSISDTISIIQEKKTRIGTEQFDGTTSEVLYNLKRMMIDPLLMQKYRALNKSVIFAEMDTLYPQGYLFRDENHLFNCFRTVADKLLNSQGTQNNFQTPKIKYTTIE
jgi:uncharacterized protein YdaU (DUF1376 family)